MEKFTKAPWSVRFTGAHWNNPKLRNIEINFGEDTECICDTVYEEANAHLIAAAPEMYALLKELSGVVDNDDIKQILAKARGEKL